MMTNRGDNEKLVPCPYDASHRILHYRLQTHLVRCNRNFMEKNPSAKIVKCLYNAVHQVPESILAYHHDNCVDRIRLDKHMYMAETVDINKFPVTKLSLQSEENWDNEVVPIYNPEEHCVNNPILRNQHTLSAAKRRDFRFRERQRMQKLLNTQEKTKEEPEVPQEKERQQQVQVPTQPRRPVSLSAGLKDDTRDVTALLEEVKLGHQTVTVPKLAKFPPSGRGAIPKHKRCENSPIWAAIAAPRGSGMCGIASTSNGKPIARGRGRGSSLTQLKK